MRKFDNFSDWDSVQDLNGEPVFDIQIDSDEDMGKTIYQFQYVNLEYRDDSINGYGLYTGLDYQGVEPEVVTESITQILAKMFQENLVK